MSKNLNEFLYVLTIADFMLFVKLASLQRMKNSTGNKRNLIAKSKKFSEIKSTSLDIARGTTRLTAENYVTRAMYTSVR
jgi:hypothetical protein